MFVDWPISHAKCVTEQQAKIKNANHVYVAMRKLQTDKSIEEIYKQHVGSDKLNANCKRKFGLYAAFRDIIYTSSIFTCGQSPHLHFIRYTPHCYMFTRFLTSSFPVERFLSTEGDSI